ncbi:HAD-superfamily hydrolase, subfamily IIB [Sanguibacter gelidistatuariae]|uniref:HAD-superfamily hydrolase, subfamily IIB n=1 Tax=Sanguibacter gelidistatuariae TaxID=1814289 RepID=A0A1G6GY90_9MICO|nr:HAD family hydrolase [Sanguibacter gelidistatuariae]SDB86921.1 HAD-superfamily hydrolase, subfamily IIB [Sanguibacter gelidistatuariae]
MTIGLGDAPGCALGDGDRLDQGRSSLFQTRAGDQLLVALDVDGTLMTYDEFLSDEVRQCVADLRAAGHQVVLATGRPLVAVLPVARDLGIDEGWVVCSNGSVTARLDPSAPGGFVLEHVVMFDPSQALRVMREHMPLARIALEEVGVGYWIDDVFPDSNLHGLNTIVAFEDLCVRQTARVVVAHARTAGPDFGEQMRSLGLIDTYFMIAGTRWMDVAPTGVTKAYALERLRAELGIDPALTVAIGDGGNDVAMLGWAARGVAMGHAEAAVIAAADEVTLSITDDGAVPVLRSLLDVERG